MQKSWHFLPQLLVATGLDSRPFFGGLHCMLLTSWYLDEALFCFQTFFRKNDCDQINGSWKQKANELIFWGIPKIICQKSLYGLSAVCLHSVSMLSISVKVLLPCVNGRPFYANHVCIHFITAHIFKKTSLHLICPLECPLISRDVAIFDLVTFLLPVPVGNELQKNPVDYIGHSADPIRHFLAFFDRVSKAAEKFSNFAFLFQNWQGQKGLSSKSLNLRHILTIWMSVMS